MLPDIGLGEMLVIAIAALVVVGPKDLPRLARQVGGVMSKARGMAREFRDAFDDMGREAEIDELRKEVAALRDANPLTEIEREMRGAEADARQALHEPKSRP